MKKAYFRFYGELNDFFSPEKNGEVHVHHFKGNPSVKDRIESLGVPHTEIFLILKGEKVIDFSYLVQNNDRISVYPIFQSLNISSKMSV